MTLKNILLIITITTVANATAQHILRHDQAIRVHFESLNKITVTNISLMVDHNNNFMYTLLGQ